MYHWFIENALRLSFERDEIERLKTASDWFVSAEWSLDNEELRVYCVVRVGGQDYEIRLDYPRYFPKVPPTVRPLNAQSKWTAHQYGGKDGPLCLEWGSDNWQPQISGADMIRSAHRLLCGETLVSMGFPENLSVPSRHKLTPGQKLRNKKGGFYIGADLNRYFSGIQNGELDVFRFSAHERQKNIVFFVHEARTGAETDFHQETTIPEFTKQKQGAEKLVNGVFIKLNLPPESIHVNGTDEFASLVFGSGCETDLFSSEESSDKIRLGLENLPFTFLILDKYNQPHLFIILSSDKPALKHVDLSEINNQNARRMPTNLERLSEKKICIVGLGSAGSKIAMSLARMQVGGLFLVDYDVFLPGNIERHTLDWNSVGSNKTVALQEAVKNLGGKTKVITSDLHLTGQESSGLIDKLTKDIGECDLIIDATAEPDVFNLLAGICSDNEKPLVWLEVFAGGKGGLIARSRSGQDPNPYIMREIYNSFCADNPAPQTVVADKYAAEDKGQNIIAASDADVAIIAHHAVRLAADCLTVSEDRSEYKSSIYLIGLSKWWIFQEPLHTVPLDTNVFRQIENEKTESLNISPDQIEFIRSLIKKRRNEVDNTV